MNESPLNDFLTAEEVGKLLRLPISTVYYLAKEGRLPAVQLGRSWRFPANEIGDLANSRPGRVRILVVDDDIVVRSLVVGALESRNCDIVEAATFASAVTATRQQRFDLLLIDLNLPDGSGVDLIRDLKGQYSPTQMVIITDFPDLAENSDLSELGMITMLRKPLSVEHLLECVKLITGGQRVPMITPKKPNPAP